MTTRTESYAGTQSVVRAIRLLKTFRGRRPEWSLSELVEAVELNKTTVFRLLTALESEGLLEKTAGGNYRLGSEMIALGGRAIRSNSLRQVAQPILNRLAQDTGERVTLEVPLTDGDGKTSMLVLDEIQSDHLLGVNQFVGTRLPIYATSTGKAILAYWPAENLDGIWQQDRLPLTEATVVDSAALTAELTQTKERGFAIARGELEAGLMAAAAPVFNHHREVAAAISVVGPSVRITESHLLEIGTAVRDAAAEVSQRLGFRTD